MDLKVQFCIPKNITPAGLDGVVVKFPFTVTYPGAGARKDKVIQYRIDVWISGTLYAMWGFGRFFTSSSIRSTKSNACPHFYFLDQPPVKCIGVK